MWNDVTGSAKHTLMNRVNSIISSSASGGDDIHDGDKAANGEKNEPANGRRWDIDI